MDRLARGVRQPVLRRALATVDLVTALGIGQGKRLTPARDLSNDFASGSHSFGADQECGESARQPAGNLRRALLPCSNP